ncbi:MFS transporter [Nocardiopsis ganjiahuensis]|uniref:MFS transporter n=1 Tax=Nocardiopsis ganjiahuensis TaxID=239984 RepID=UPI00034750AC|nr:MFS transporter [Nocardiopsis ganjiahuensis]
MSPTTPPNTTSQLERRGTPLLRPSFVRLWCGTTASGLATWAMPFILGLAVLEGSLSAVGLGLVLATRTAGFLVAVPLGGLLADRHSRRAVVLWSGLAAAAASPVLAAGLGTSTALMAVAAAVVGVGQGACRPAFQALTAEVVAVEDRQQANAALTFSVRGVTFIAPGLTALLSTVAGPQALLLITAALWLAAALLPRGGGAPPPDRPARAPFHVEFAEGLTEARRHTWFLAGLGALTVVIALGYSATSVLLPLASRDHYGTEAVLAGALTAYTGGALIGALLVARWKPRAQGWWALFGLALYALAPLSLVFPVGAFWVFAAYAVVGVGVELFNVPWFTAAQREVAPDKLARVSSLDFLFAYGFAPVGLALIAPAAQLFGTQGVLLACAALCVAAPALAALAPGARDFRTHRA